MNFNHKVVHLIKEEEVDKYYDYLLKAFENEILGASRRQLIEDIASKPLFSKQDADFLKKIVINAFVGRDPYHGDPFLHHRFEHPIELLNFIVQEGYTPSSPFVIW